MLSDNKKKLFFLFKRMENGRRESTLIKKWLLKILTSMPKIQIGKRRFKQRKNSDRY